MRRWLIATGIVLGTGALLAGCANPARLDSQQVQRVMDEIVIDGPDRMNVGEALDIAPHGAIGVLDAREARIGQPSADPIDPLEAEHADWIVVSTCGSAGASPSVLLVALPESEATAYLDAPWGTSCDMT